MTFIIHFSELDLTKANIQGLELLMDMALIDEKYEYAALIRDELNRRSHNTTH